MNIFEGTHITLDLKHYPNRVFFFKGDIIWMEYDWENKDLWCRWEGFWEVLEEENGWEYYEVQAFIENQVEEHFKVKGFTPIFPLRVKNLLVEEHFKVKGFTPMRELVVNDVWWKNISK